MNKSELVAAIASKADISKKDAEAALKAFTDTVGAQLKKGENYDFYVIPGGVHDMKAWQLHLYHALQVIHVSLQHGFLFISSVFLF